MFPRGETRRYQITVEGNVGERIQATFPGLETDWDHRHSVLNGPVRDQSQLHGILALIRDLNVPLLAVSCLDDIDLTETL